VGLCGLVGFGVELWKQFLCVFVCATCGILDSGVENTNLALLLVHETPAVDVSVARRPL
jgi:hypothetical protein